MTTYQFGSQFAPSQTAPPIPTTKAKAPAPAPVTQPQATPPQQDQQDAAFQALLQQHNYTPPVSSGGGQDWYSYVKGGANATPDTSSDLKVGNQTIVGGGAAKVIRAVTGSEVSAGKDISAALELNYPGVQDALKKAQDSNNQLGDVFKKLLQKSHDLRLQGKDTSQLDEVIKEDAKVLGMTSIDNLLPDAAKKTPLQIAADFGGVALDTITAGALEKAAGSSWKLVSAADKANLLKIGVTDEATAKTLLEHLGGTVKKIAAGGAVGYGYDVSGKLQNGETGPAAFTPGLGTVIGSAIPLGGDLAALGFGKAKSAVSDFVDKAAAEKTTAKSEQATKNAYEAITPSTKDLTPTEYKDLLNKGRIAPGSATEAPTYILNDKEKALAEKYSPLLQGKDPVRNINTTLKEIITKDKEVGDFLAKDKSVYQKADLQKTLTERLSGVSDITIPKAQLAQARKDLIATVMSRIPENNSGRTFDRLWSFRKNFDATIEKKLNAFSGAPTLKKEMATELRNGIQDFIANNTKDGVYKGKMKDMSDLYNVIDMLDTSAVKTKGMNGIKMWMRANPGKTKLIEGALGAGAVETAIHFTH